MLQFKVTLDEGKKITAHFNDHVIVTDQPVRGGGENSAPAPFDLFLASIGTCAGIYVKSFCEQRGISTSNISITQSVEFDFQKHLPSLIRLEISLPDDFPEKYRSAVINAAELCAVKRSIADPPQFEVITVTE